LIEKDGDKVFNTAVIFDRQGEFAGKYRKTHLHGPEVFAGTSCGDEYPVFELDFGKVGIQTCYDEWFPEVSRVLAFKGAEILLLPVAGGKPITWRVRALDNGVYFVAAGQTPPSMIIDSSGAILAETQTPGFVWADLNLDWRETNIYKDPTLMKGMPTIHPAMRFSADDDLEIELCRLMSQGKVTA
jgi:predicted amidohydrolase